MQITRERPRFTVSRDYSHELHAYITTGGRATRPARYQFFPFWMVRVKLLGFEIVDHMHIRPKCIDSGITLIQSDPVRLSVSG